MQREPPPRRDAYKDETARYLSAGRGGNRLPIFVVLKELCSNISQNWILNLRTNILPASKASC